MTMQTAIYRLEPEVGQWQEQRDQQSADRRRTKRGKGQKECKTREEQEKMDQLAAAMAQLAQAQQQMLQQNTLQRTCVDMAIYQEGEDIDTFLETYDTVTSNSMR